MMPFSANGDQIFLLPSPLDEGQQSQSYRSSGSGPLSQIYGRSRLGKFILKEDKKPY
jgi:hypothetical protein